jgi:hypothetical protein
MENLEKECLDRLNKILSKFYLQIDIVHVVSLNVLQYRLVDNLLNKTDSKSEWLRLWLSLNDLLFHQQSIFHCLESYYLMSNNFNFLTYTTHNIASKYKRYSKAYQSIQPLKSCYLEEFIIKMDLLGV